MPKEVTSTIKKIKEKETIKKTEEKARVKSVQKDKNDKAEKKDAKKEKTKNEPRVLDEVVEEQQEDITQHLENQELGEQVLAEIEHDRERPYEVQAYEGDQRQTQDHYHTPPGEYNPGKDTSGFYKRPGQGHYKGREKAFKDTDEDINLHKQIKKYLRG